MTTEIDPIVFNQDYKLISDFKRFAPGTYRHSCNVSAIFESVAEEVEIDTTLAKVLGLYHDIGKINAPNLFSENQSEDTNIHDTLDPVVSYYLITKHVSDSVLILVQNNFPLRVIEIISQHHGNNILYKFFEKQAKGSLNKILEDNFRYPSVKPTCVESCLLMLVDSCEAAVQSEIQYNSANKDTLEIIEETVEKVCSRLIKDGQLDNLKIGTYNITKQIIIDELKSQFKKHKRVPYDKNGDSEKDIEEKTFGQIKEV